MEGGVRILNIQEPSFLLYSWSLLAVFVYLLHVWTVKILSKNEAWISHFSAPKLLLLSSLLLLIWGAGWRKAHIYGFIPWIPTVAGLAGQANTRSQEFTAMWGEGDSTCCPLPQVWREQEAATGRRARILKPRSFNVGCGYLTCRPNACPVSL